MKIKLSEITDAFDFMDETSEYFLDKETGELVYINDMYMDRVEAEALSEQLDEHGFYRLPDQREIREYDTMEAFADTLSGAAQEKLYDAISGHGAFSRFKNEIRQLDLQEKWYSFRDDARKQKAIAWCEENDIEWD